MAPAANMDLHRRMQNVRNGGHGLVIYILTLQGHLSSVPQSQHKFLLCEHFILLVKCC